MGGFDPRFVVIVGVGGYQSAAYKRPGVVNDAIRWVTRVLGQGVPKEKIILGLSPLPKNGMVEIALPDGPVQIPAELPTRVFLESVFTRLAARDAGTKLLFVWIGHGSTRKVGERVLYYADATVHKVSCVSLDSLLLRLHFDPFEHFREQNFIVDACRTLNSSIAVGDVDTPSTGVPDASAKHCALIHQSILQSTSGVEQATVTDQFTHFHEALFEALKAMPATAPFPFDHAVLEKSLLEELRRRKSKFSPDMVQFIARDQTVQIAHGEVSFSLPSRDSPEVVQFVRLLYSNPNLFDALPTVWRIALDAELRELTTDPSPWNALRKLLQRAPADNQLRDILLLANALYSLDAPIPNAEREFLGLWLKSVTGTRPNPPSTPRKVDYAAVFDVRPATSGFPKEVQCSIFKKQSDEWTLFERGTTLVIRSYEDVAECVRLFLDGPALPNRGSVRYEFVLPRKCIFLGAIPVALDEFGDSLHTTVPVIVRPFDRLNITTERDQNAREQWLPNAPTALATGVTNVWNDSDSSKTQPTASAHKWIVSSSSQKSLHVAIAAGAAAIIWRTSETAPSANELLERIQQFHNPHDWISAVHSIRRATPDIGIELLWDDPAIDPTPEPLGMDS